MANGGAQVREDVPVSSEQQEASERGPGRSRPGPGEEAADAGGLMASRRVPAETRPHGPEMSRLRLHSPYTAYHESGHAVAFWYHGVRFRYVTLEPRIPGNAGHVYGVRLREAGDPTGLATQMRFAAAGEIAYGRISRSSHVSSDRELLSRFRRAAAEPEDPFLTVDEREFARAGLRRDAMLTASYPDQIAGPASWLSIWRDTEELIRGTLWPAVYAVAWEMVFSSRALTYAEVATIAAAGLAQAGSEIRAG